MFEDNSFNNNYNNINNNTNNNFSNNFNQNSNGMNQNPNINSNNINPNMNQNLNPNMSQNIKNLNMNSNVGNKGKKPNSKLILFGGGTLIVLILIMVLVFAIVKNKQTKSKIEKSKKAATEPIIKVIANKENTKLTIEVEHTEKLKNISYAWEEDPKTEKTVDAGRNETFTINNVDIPLGTNTLSIIARDENGTQAKYKNKFTNNLGEDIGSPKITFSLEKRGKNIKVNVKDNNVLKKVTYKWNDDKEHNVELQEDSQSEVSFNVKIFPGKNTFYVTAEDTNGNISKKERKYEGIEAPTLNFAATPDGKSVILKVFHPLGVKSIEYKLNGEIFRSDDIKGNLTTVEVTINLSKENNEIEATATSVDGVTAHPEVRSVKMRKREEVDEFGERKEKDEKQETDEIRANDGRREEN